MISKQFGKYAVASALALSAVFPMSAMAEDYKQVTLSADSNDVAINFAMKIKDKGYFPFIMIGGDESLRAEANAVAKTVGNHIHIAYINVPDLDGDERNMVVQNIGKDGNICATMGFNGDVESFGKTLKESVKQAYYGDCQKPKTVAALTAN